MADRISLVRWRDAVADPPVCEARGYRDPVLAQLSHIEAAPAWWDNREFSAWDDDDTYQPSLWARFPTPPGEDALTLDDLLYALRAGVRRAEDDATMFHVCDPNGDGEQVYARRANRLRHAIEEAER